MNPLGNFDPNAPINEKAVTAARALLADLPDCTIKRGYLHWYVSSYDPPADPDYNGMAYMRDGIWAMEVTHDPRDNASGVNEASHTWHRNTGAIGVTIAAMGGASISDFGPYPVTVAGLEYLCAAMAAFAQKYNLDTRGTVTDGPTHQGDAGTVDTTGEPIIITHAEAAIFDGYYCGHTSDPDCRWDLATFVPVQSLTLESATACGDALRERVRAYKIALQ